MRDYGIISPQFWIGRTGKSLRGNLPAQVIALYLMTSPHANMIGVFYCPLDYMAKETGIPLQGAYKALRSLIDGSFCQFDEATEEIFVKRMAAFQIGVSLDIKDNRCKGVAKELDKVTSVKLQHEFHAIYCEAFHLAFPAEKATPVLEKTESPLQAPPKPGSGSGSGSERVQASLSAQPINSKGSRLPTEWSLPENWRSWAENERPDLDAGKVAENFRDFWIGKPGKDGRKSDWEATWRNWIRSTKIGAPQSAAATDANAWMRNAE